MFIKLSKLFYENIIHYYITKCTLYNSTQPYKNKLRWNF